RPSTNQRVFVAAYSPEVDRMERTWIRKLLQYILEEELDHPIGELRDDASLVKEFALDSLDYMSLVMRVEETFRIRITNVDPGTTSTVGSLIDLIAVELDQTVSRRTVRPAA